MGVGKLPTRAAPGPAPVAPRLFPSAPWAPLFLLLGLAGCVGAPVAPHPTEPLAMPPLQVEGDAALARLNAEELFAKGTSAYASREWARAAACFERLAVAFPESPHVVLAQYNAGLARERLGDWEEARQHFEAIANPDGTGDALDAAFHLAEALYHLGRYPEASALLAHMAGRADLSVARRLEAEVQQGVCEVDDGRLDAGEKTLRQALALWNGAAEHDTLEDYFPAQAQFFLGEIYRLHYVGVQLNPEQGADELAKELEFKAELLLSAQGHYFRTIKIGNAYWATAAGTQIGSLYQDMYQQISDSRAPRELNEEEARVYRQELRKRVRVLLTKAITVYESTLAAAERLGSSGPFVDRARESLERMKQLLLEDAVEDAEAPTPAHAPARQAPSEPMKTPAARAASGGSG
jgi:tetratricopeptide (TPR) repeat protein